MMPRVFCQLIIEMSAHTRQALPLRHLLPSLPFRYAMLLIHAAADGDAFDADAYRFMLLRRLADEAS